VCCTPVIPALRRLRQERYKFEPNLGYVVTCLKKKEGRKEGGREGGKEGGREGEGRGGKEGRKKKSQGCVHSPYSPGTRTMPGPFRPLTGL
jgi:hypothetical protein